MNKSDYNVLLAKPSGITMKQHIEDVVSESMAICQILPASLELYSKVTKKNLTNSLCNSAKWHDEGKSCDKWQNACKEDYTKFLLWKSNNPSRSFSEYSEENPQEAGKNIRKCGVRHEMESLRMVNTDELSDAELIAIAAHHGKLGYGFDDKWEKVKDHKEYWMYFRRLSNKVIEKDSFSYLCKKNYEYNAIRGLLQLADHRASAKEEGDMIPHLEPFSYVFPHEEKRGIQQLVEQKWNRELLLVRAPTGSGKTDAALLWASKQIEAHKADRLIIAMPTRFTANAIAINVSKDLSQTGIYHSSAWSIKKENVRKGEINLKEALAQHKMARQLASPVTVCTIDHLLMSLTLTREDHHLINFNLANSCVVIDEADFYDDYTLANIMFLLKVLHEWKVPVLVMSASLPKSIIPLYKGLGYKNISMVEDKTNANNTREKYEIKDIINYDQLTQLDELIDKCFIKGNGIIYMNTVNKAIALYKHIAERKSEEEMKLVHLYHSRFTEPDKVKKEKDLLEALGKGAWREGKAKGIAILTQIGEMSINISADIMISELCPIDRLIQRAGRLCRFSDNVGSLHILIPFENETLYPAPYGVWDFNEKCWKPHKALLRTKELLHVGFYSVTDMVKLLNNVYKETYVFSDDAKDNAKELEEKFKNNWLICPAEISDEDEEESGDWRSRNIPNQNDVFVKSPITNSFKSFSKFIEYKALYGVCLPWYARKKGCDILHKIDIQEVQIGDVYLKIYIVRDDFYDYEKGIDLTEEGNYL